MIATLKVPDEKFLQVFQDEVVGDFNPRGGIGIVVTAARGAGFEYSKE